LLVLSFLLGALKSLILKIVNLLRVQRHHLATVEIGNVDRAQIPDETIGPDMSGHSIGWAGHGPFMTILNALLASMSGVSKSPNAGECRGIPSHSARNTAAATARIVRDAGCDMIVTPAKGPAPGASTGRLKLDRTRQNARQISPETARCRRRRGNAGEQLRRALLDVQFAVVHVGSWLATLAGASLLSATILLRRFGSLGWRRRELSRASLDDLADFLVELPKITT
jgi:hypothetical protein